MLCIQGNLTFSNFRRTIKKNNDRNKQMKGNKIVIQHLNKVLANQLVAINQFFLHSRMYNDWGLESLGDNAYHHSIKEMKQADKVIERILFLEGLPNLQDLGKLSIGENTEEMIDCDLKQKQKSTSDLRDAVICCEETKDYVSRDLLKHILREEEEHIDWLEAQVGLIKKMTIKNYLQNSVKKED